MLDFVEEFPYIAADTFHHRASVEWEDTQTWIWGRGKKRRLRDCRLLDCLLGSHDQQPEAGVFARRPPGSEHQGIGGAFSVPAAGAVEGQEANMDLHRPAADFAGGSSDVPGVRPC